MEIRLQRRGTVHLILTGILWIVISGLYPAGAFAEAIKQGAGSEDQLEKAKAEIVALVDRFNKAINEGDVPASVAVYDVDVESFPLFTLKYMTTAQRTAAAKRAAESGVRVTTKRNDDMKVHVIANDWAWAHWTWHTVSVTPQGERREADGRTTFILHKRNSAWKVVHSHISEPNRAVGPPQPGPRPSGDK